MGIDNPYRSLDFPSIDLETKWEDEHLKYYDTFRRKWLVLTPEEWVRQHAIHFLIQIENYPKSLLSLEKTGGLEKGRYDALWYSNSGKPFLLVECKSTSIAITQKTLVQAGGYAKKLQAPYVFLTNGLKHVCLASGMAGRKAEILRQLPAFPT